MADFSYAGIEEFTPGQQRLLRHFIDSHNHVAAQVNASPVGDIAPPPAHTAAKVSGSGGVLDVQIADKSAQYRGAHHFVDVSKDASFSNPQTFSDGPSTSIRRPLPNGTYYTRSYAQYPTSGQSAVLNHGPIVISGSAQPDLAAGDGKMGFGPKYNTPLPPKRA